VPNVHQNAGSLMAAEIAEQPAVLQRLLTEGSAEITAAAAQIRSRAPRFVLLAARGTSDHAALYAKYLVEIKLGLPAGLISPSTMTIYGARPDLSDVLFIAVSQSGGSPDLIDSLVVARECGALTVAVTNNPNSPLAAAAEISVDVMAGTERAVAATKTYTAELLAVYLLLTGAKTGSAGSTGSARNIGSVGNTGRARNIRSAGNIVISHGADALPAAAELTLAGAQEAADAAAQRYRFAEQLVVSARGYSYPTAREAALKLMETSYLNAQAFSGADLLHGPMAMLDAEVPVIAVVTPGVGGDAMAPVLERLREVRTDVLLVGSPDGLPVATSGISEELLPILEILPLQQLAWRLAVDRGEDPDRPRGLSKVTHTW
jgi:glucosamine--fructose-6-phosphate aminotransferase (isomerizing)